MNDLISKNKLLKDLAGMYDVMIGAGDPFLASMIRKAMECVERQPAAEDEQDPIADGRFWAAVLQLEREYKKAEENPFIEDPVASALFSVWGSAVEGVL